MNDAQVGIFLVVNCGRSAQEAYEAVKALGPFVDYRDASMGPSTFGLSVLHCLQVRVQVFSGMLLALCCLADLEECEQGIQRAKSSGFIDWETFDAEEYEHYEKVENGDANWILPGTALYIQF